MSVCVCGKRLVRADNDKADPVSSSTVHCHQSLVCVSGVRRVSVTVQVGPKPFYSARAKKQTSVTKGYMVKWAGSALYRLIFVIV